MDTMRKEYDLCLPWEEQTDHDVLAGIKNEFLFRLNPHWIINDFSTSSQSYSADISDHETGQPAPLSGTIQWDVDNYILSISSDGDEWTAINFFAKGGSLQVEVTYLSEPPEDIERKVVLWLRSIQQYLRLYKTSSLNTRFFRMLMNRVILQMTPSQRKISLMLVRITILELLVITLILVGWFFFFR